MTEEDNFPFGNEPRLNEMIIGYITEIVLYNMSHGIMESVIRDDIDFYYGPNMTKLVLARVRQKQVRESRGNYYGERHGLDYWLTEGHHRVIT